MSDATGLLLLWNGGDVDARDALLREVYSELNAIAAGQLAGEVQTSELQPGELVHEAWLRLIDLKRVTWANRAHFKAMSAQIMRQILIDKARMRNAAKRSGGIRVTLTGLGVSDESQRTDFMMLNAAIEKLANLDEKRARLVELLYFGGLTVEEAAQVVGVSTRTLKRQWAVVRGWLYRELTRGNPASNED